MKNVDVDAVVVGGGISGLYAARCLKAEGLKVVVLEARNYVGGRSITKRGTEGEYADMGGAYFGIHQTRIAQLANELGLTMYPLPSYGKTALRFKGTTKFFTGDIPATYNVLELMDLGNVIRVLDSLSLQVDLDEPWSSPKAEKFDSMSIVDFLDSVCWTTFAKTLMYIGFRAVFEVRPEHISFLYALHLIRSCGGAKALFSSQKDGLQAIKVVGGCSLISERMAAELGCECVLLGQQVTEINQSTSDVEVVTQNGSVFKTKVVVVATSPSVLRSVKWTPSLPEVQQKYVNLKLEKHSFKTVMYYPTAHWTAAGLKGDLVSDCGIVQVAFPDTKRDGSYPAIMGFVEDYEQLTTEQRKEAIANHYADVFGIEAMRHPTDYVEKYWDDESELVFSGPCVFSLPPNFLCKQRQFWGQPFGRVFFAGSESSVVFRGYMEGAVRSAGKAAFDVLKVLNKSPLQNHLASCRNPVEGVPYSKLTFVERWVPGVTQFLYGVAVAVVPCLAVFVARFF